MKNLSRTVLGTALVHGCPASVCFSTTAGTVGGDDTLDKVAVSPSKVGEITDVYVAATAHEAGDASGMAQGDGGR